MSNRLHLVASAVALLGVVACSGESGPTTAPVSPSSSSARSLSVASSVKVSASGSGTYTNGVYTMKLTNNGGTPSDVVARLVECWRTNYPKMASRFNSNAAKTVTFVIDPNYGGVAATSGANTTLRAAWINGHPWDDDVVTHEQMHVVQAYNGNTPGWAVEGLADYARYRYGLYNLQGGWALPAFSSSQRYTDSYRVTARFFAWLENHKKSTFPQDLDAKLRSGTYSDSWWNAEFGQTVDQMWSAYAANPEL